MGKAAKSKTTRKQRELEAGIAFNDIMVRRVLAGDPNEKDRQMAQTYMLFRWTLTRKEEEIPERLVEAHRIVLKTVRKAGADFLRDRSMPNDPAEIAAEIEAMWDRKDRAGAVVDIVGLMVPSFRPKMEDGEPSFASSVMLSMGIAGDPDPV